MKNIQKIAEEIFQAPSDEDLIQRAISNNAYFISQSEWQKRSLFNDSQRSVRSLDNLNLFHNGVFRLQYLDQPAFAALDRYLTGTKWSVIYRGENNKVLAYKAKINNKTAVLIEVNGDPFEYYFEKGLVEVK
jgi:hypothetical protein